MDTDTAISAREQLEKLRAELEARGWPADHRGPACKPFLHVRNPADPGFNDSVAYRAGRYCWNWGPEITPVDDVQEVADCILHVLRVVGP
jgi:hypothetical protein